MKKMSNSSTGMKKMYKLKYYVVHLLGVVCLLILDQGCASFVTQVMSRLIKNKKKMVWYKLQKCK